MYFFGVEVNLDVKNIKYCSFCVLESTLTPKKYI